MAFTQYGGDVRGSRPEEVPYYPQPQERPLPPSAPAPLGGRGWTPANRNELVQYAKQNNWSEDFDRFKDENTVNDWIKNYWDAEKGKFRTAKTDEQGNRLEGWVEKPDETPEGWSAYRNFAVRNDDPRLQNLGAGAGQGGPGVQGGWGQGPGGPGGQGGPDDMAMYQLKQRYAEALRDPSKRFELLAGTGAIEQNQAQVDQLRQQAEGLPEPARSQMLARLQDFQQGANLDMQNKGQQAALSGLSGIVQPENSWLLGKDQSALGWAGLGLQEKLGMGNLGLQRENLGLQRELGLGNLNLNRDQFSENQRQFNQNFGEGQRQFNISDATQRYGIDKSTKKPGFWGSLGGIIGGIASQTSKGPKGWTFSDFRIKDKIGSGRRGLSDLLKLGVYSYSYKPELDPEQAPQQGVIAQELERVAPEMVRSIDGVKAVNHMSMLAMTMQAVKELAQKVEKKERKR